MACQRPSVSLIEDCETTGTLVASQASKRCLPRRVPEAVAVSRGGDSVAAAVVSSEDVSSEGTFECRANPMRHLVTISSKLEISCSDHATSKRAIALPERYRKDIAYGCVRLVPHLLRLFLSMSALMLAYFAGTESRAKRPKNCT